LRDLLKDGRKMEKFVPKFGKLGLLPQVGWNGWMGIGYYG